MAVGTPPFTRATKNDPYYKLIAEENYNGFWKAHARFFPSGFFTNDFKDLLSRMLAYNPDNRLTIE